LNNFLILSLLITATLMVSAEAVSSPLLNHTSNLSFLQLDVSDVDEGEDSSSLYVESTSHQFGIFVTKTYSSNHDEKSKNNSVTYSIRAPPA